MRLVPHLYLRVWCKLSTGSADNGRLARCVDGGLTCPPSRINSLSEQRALNTERPEGENGLGECQWTCGGETVEVCEL